MNPDPRLPKPEKLPWLGFRSEPEGATMAVAFIHGLGGDCYKTWGRKGEPATFLDRLAADLPGVAVATYGYESGLPRLLNPKRYSVAGQAAVWADKLRDALLEEYKTVAIVCHSLGGVMTLTALRMLTFNEPDWARTLRDGKVRLILFLMGTPVFGTDAAQGWMPEELKVLEYNNDLLRDNKIFWDSRVQQPYRAHGPDDVPILTFAVVSEKDKWVTQFSADAGLEKRQISRVMLTHEELVKPPLEGRHDPYDFVVKNLRAELENPSLPPPRAEMPLPAPPEAHYVDRPAILADNERAAQKIEEASEAFGRREYVAASRAYLSAVQIAVNALQTEHDGILAQAEICPAEDTKPLLKRLVGYLQVSRLKKHLDAAEKGLPRCRDALVETDPAKARVVEDAHGSLARLIGDLRLKRQDADGKLKYLRTTAIGVETLQGLRDYLEHEVVTQEGLEERVEWATADPGKERLATALDAIEDAESAL